MPWYIEIKDKRGIFDAVGAGIKKDILDLGITSVREVCFAQVYLIDGTLSRSDIERICVELLTDSLAQEYSISSSLPQAARRRSTRPDRMGRYAASCGSTRPDRMGRYAASCGSTRPDRMGRYAASCGGCVIEVAYNPGVMDPVEESTLKGIRDLGISGAGSVKTAKKYYLKGALSDSERKTIAEKLLCNKLIQHIVGDASEALPPQPQYHFRRITVDLIHASDATLQEISKRGQLFLTLHEMRQIRSYFKKAGRNPTDCELETIAQTWSEHCWHKTFRGKIRYHEEVRSSKFEVRKKIKSRLIDNLLKSTIMKATRDLKKPWCVSVFQDNSGVIRFDEKHNVCFKVETHNHPSALEPFGGANTGIGGVIRDPLGTGLGAKPILNTDVFCFGPPDMAFSRVPKGSLHPKRIAKGVVAGVRDYGNKMGIPTVNGAVLFHERFVGNPLVFCGTVGIMPKDKSFKKTRTDECVVVVGGRTGRDGIHGATFSSGELTHESETISSGAVQIGNPIQEKKMVDTILQARDKNLFTAITDCGAGGLSSAVGEMGGELGVEVHLEKVPLKYKGLSYTEIWISESQERMLLSVAPERVAELLEVFRSEDVEATVIGTFTDTKRLILYYQGNRVCDIDMAFLHEGLPRITKKARFAQSPHREPKVAPQQDLTPVLTKLLSHYDICSKEWVIRQYDHEVQGGSVLKPLTGCSNDGPSDASIVKPVLGSKKGIIVANGINFRFGFIDPYWMAASCIDEALRQIIAVGGSLKQVALLDNFCWGNPDKPDRLGGLVRSAYGCRDFAKVYGTPFISGKDSLYNEYAVHGRSTAIPGTLLISALAVMDDVTNAVSMYAKKPGDLIYAVGLTRDELGGSHYYDLQGAIGNSVPKVFPKEALKTFRALAQCSARGLVRAMHDCSDGGLGVALAEVAFAGNLGMEVFLSEVPFEVGSSKLEVRNAKAKNRTSNLELRTSNYGKRSMTNERVLFSESNSRFVVEVAPEKRAAFEKALGGVAYGLIGCVTASCDFKVYGIEGKPCVRAQVSQLKEAWSQPMRW